MHHNETTSCTDVFHERLLGLFRPGGSVVVGNNDGILGKVWLESRIRPLLGRGRHVDMEQLSLFQVAFHHLGRFRPNPVIILTFNNQSLQRFSSLNLQSSQH